MTGPNYAAECAMKCEEERFRHFLRDASKLPVTNGDEAKIAIYKLCRIESRRELNSTPEKATRWCQVKSWFLLWKDGVGTNESGRRYSPKIMGQAAFSRGTSLAGNPFQRPELRDEGDTPYDLWELGWRQAKTRSESYEKSKQKKG